VRTVHDSSLSTTKTVNARFCVEVEAPFEAERLPQYVEGRAKCVIDIHGVKIVDPNFRRYEMRPIRCDFAESVICVSYSKLVPLDVQYRDAQQSGSTKPKTLRRLDEVGR